MTEPNRAESLRERTRRAVQSELIDAAQELFALRGYEAVTVDEIAEARARGLEYKPADYSFGSFEDVIRNLDAKLTAQPYAVGSSFTAADTQLASSLGFTMNILQVVPKLPAFLAYLERVGERPAFKRSQELDNQLVQQHPEIMEALSQR